VKNRLEGFSDPEWLWLAIEEKEPGSYRRGLPSW